MTKTTTDAKHWKFYFTVTDAARFLGKSPVTLRQWERKGLVKFPRESEGGDRRFDTTDIRRLAYIAASMKRISDERFNTVVMATAALDTIERMNYENRPNRNA
jgi:hypothetical protein